MTLSAFFSSLLPTASCDAPPEEDEVKGAEEGKEEEEEGEEAKAGADGEDGAEEEEEEPEDVRSSQRALDFCSCRLMQSPCSLCFARNALQSAVLWTSAYLSAWLDALANSARVN